MTCTEARRTLLELDWRAEQRRHASEALKHLDGCVECQKAMDDFDRLQEELKPQAAPADPIGGWWQFEDRLLQSIPRQRQSWLPQALKLAAAFLLGVTMIEAVRWAVSHQDHQIATNLPTVPANTTRPVSSPPFTPQEVAQSAQAFDEVSQVFDRRTSWVMLANDTSDVGLSDTPIVEQRKLLLLRLTMTRGGEPISSNDLVIVPGQSASLSVPIQQGQSLHYEIGTTAGNPMKLSLWAELKSAQGGQTVGALATQLQLQPNEKTSAGELVTSSGVYQLKVGFSQALIGGGKL